MKNKKYCIFLVLFLCFGLVSCAGYTGYEKEQISSFNKTDHQDYSFMLNESGEHCIVLENQKAYAGNRQILARVYFKNMKEFKDSVVNGKLTVAQKEIMANFTKDSEGRILVCDFDNLYCPTLPENQINSVGWAGRTYAFSLSIDENISGTIQYLTKSIYESWYLDDYQNYLKSDTIHITKTEMINGDQKAIYYYTSEGKFVKVQYSFHKNGKEYCIDKSYTLSMKNKSFKFTPNVPVKVKIYCIDGDLHYITTLFGFTEDPTDAWLLQFGLTKYVENDHVDK